MSKFLDITTVQGNNQIEVIDSKGICNDINFYNKKDSSGNLILGFRASENNVIMSSVLNGATLTDLESFSYSTVTEPISSDISDLIGKLNAFLYT